MAETLKRERGLIARHVFCYVKGEKAGKGLTEGGFNKAWREARINAASCRRSARFSSATARCPPHASTIARSTTTMATSRWRSCRALAQDINL